MLGGRLEYDPLQWQLHMSAVCILQPQQTMSDMHLPISFPWAKSAQRLQRLRQIDYVNSEVCGDRQ